MAAQRPAASLSLPVASMSPLSLRGTVARNRWAMSPMCMYACEARDGVVTDFHLQHLAARASGGCGVVITEATAIEARGRITLEDAGIWHDGHVAPWARVAASIRSFGAVALMQLAHAGRKAGTRRPQSGRRGPYEEHEVGDDVDARAILDPIGPSPLRFADGMRLPRPATSPDLAALEAAFVSAARRAITAGFDGVELHMAHGYLLHSFLSPRSNVRDDGWGGSHERRMAFPLRVAAAVRAAMPADAPLWARISATDWLDDGWTLDHSVDLSRRLADIGVDLVDVSSGGIDPMSRPPVDRAAEPGYQVPLASRIRREAGVAVAAVGGLGDPRATDAVVAEGHADIVLLGRRLLADACAVQRAALDLGAPPPWPDAYAWALT